ncbi:hypothetical protein AGABI1DRAFT_131770 [Agaricus bisporus var. burnettii JB137-S8]|uniref:Uncharacterized protein n=1 Tax=Agaricus bisporus var. burnettii (strain JB137-S8 / ATCC MYA-4627 / FGSC 10392) TaxID=597362 RepID=K5WYF3_AGABU|nr:uncharacterized protein AGABI1DRAFT_131770 [Agaricus bisporus var. burnettii JB137-S8]EKM75863.1 hypothetical protein AGABI1DRAFT_131770 [Agaricus bisporus var. burnettii JB137-S8]
MDNTATPILEGELLLGTQLELVTPTTVAGTFYGIAFTLFCLYVDSLASQFRDEDRKRRAKFMLGYSSIIMLCGLYSLVSNAWITQDAYIKHGNYPGGPYFYVLATFHAPVMIAAFTCQIVIDILTSAIQIWRVWVIWSATRYAKPVIVLPVLCLLALAALDLRTIILQTTLPVADVLRLDRKAELAKVAIQGTTTILCTVLISLFLTFQHWRQRKLIGEANGSAGYMKIVAMLIESYALESIWILTQTIVLFHPVLAFFAESRPYIQIIAYLLVQYRVASGKAYESQRGQSILSSMHWNQSNRATIQLGEGSEVNGDSHLSLKPVEANALYVSNMG